jgi:2-methylisocitrate lyase-like PEP mutase family enzyme
MDRSTQTAMAEAFRARHHTHPVLVLPNVWDGMSAALFAAAGFEALATTSGGLGWALGYPDGEAAPWEEVVAATARIVRTTNLPVTADIETGYGATPAEVGAHVAEIVGAGIVGINIEDGLHGPIREMADAAARIRAARAAADAKGVPIVINARCDVMFFGRDDSAKLFHETVARCKAYIEAGADSVYPFGLRDPETIGRFCGAVAAPVNVTGRAGMPDAAALERRGVARITIATAPALVAMTAIRDLAHDLRATGRFDRLAAAITHPDAQKLFAPKG